MQIRPPAVITLTQHRAVKRDANYPFFARSCGEGSINLPTCAQRSQVFYRKTADEAVFISFTLLLPHHFIPSESSVSNTPCFTISIFKPLKERSYFVYG